MIKVIIIVSVIYFDHSIQAWIEAQFSILSMRVRFENYALVKELDVILRYDFMLAYSIIFIVKIMMSND